jgi:prepilin-type N-terminal cleavage/methylation domain-containing protein
MEIMTQSNHNYHNNGFTLIELLVVISIIGILVSGVLASLNDARVSAQYTAAKQEMRLISDASMLMTPESIALRQVTGSNCSMCSCAYAWGGPADLRNIPLSVPCMSTWQAAIARIDAASPVINSSEPLLRDPWGSPYMLNENEEEYTPPCTYQDSITSAGPDGLFWSADDYVLLMPFRTGQCSGR